MSVYCYPWSLEDSHFLLVNSFSSLFLVYIKVFWFLFARPSCSHCFMLAVNPLSGQQSGSWVFTASELSIISRPFLLIIHRDTLKLLISFSSHSSHQGHYWRWLKNSPISISSLRMNKVLDCRSILPPRSRAPTETYFGWFASSIFNDWFKKLNL